MQLEGDLRWSRPEGSERDSQGQQALGLVQRGDGHEERAPTRKGAERS